MLPGYLDTGRALLGNLGGCRTGSPASTSARCLIYPAGVGSSLMCDCRCAETCARDKTRLRALPFSFVKLCASSSCAMPLLAAAKVTLSSLRGAWQSQRDNLQKGWRLSGLKVAKLVRFQTRIGIKHTRASIETSASRTVAMIASLSRFTSGESHHLERSAQLLGYRMTRLVDVDVRRKGTTTSPSAAIAAAAV